MGKASDDPVGASKAFLEAREKESDVVKLASGLMYRVLRKGKGKAHPLAGTSCDCHYSGTLVDGTKFDSSYDRGSPTSFAPNQVIKGWTEAMQLMVEGDKWEMYIPSDLAYGDRGSPPKIPGKSALVFTMEILAIKGATKPAVNCDIDTLEDCTDKEKKYIEKMKSGSKTPEELSKEYTRLKEMFDANAQSKNLTKKQREWLEARVKILKAITEKPKEEL